MADGEDTGPVDANPTGPNASGADFVPLDDSSSSSSSAQDTPIRGHKDDDDDDDDSASDVSMAQETDDESDVEPTSTIPSAPGPRDDQPDIQVNDEVGDVATSKKRKSLADKPDGQSLLENQEVKKVKTQQPGHIQSPLSNGNAISVHSDRSTLPAEIWHHIFTFCPPRTLGKLLLVNRLFSSYLVPSSTIRSDEPRPLSAGVLALVKPNSMWQASRRRFWPTMPAPLQDKTELDMWQLSCSSSCQFCGKSAPVQHPDPSEPWQQGPGTDGIAIIWAFASRSCGTCLLTKSIKVCNYL